MFIISLLLLLWLSRSEELEKIRRNKRVAAQILIQLAAMLHFGILFKLIGNKLVQTLDINLVPDSWKLIFGGLLVIETPIFELYPRNLADQAKCV